MKISAALIVKNEERTLGRCLASFGEHVDEIVIVDTGSTDRTQEVARRFTDRVYSYPWRRDFAQARQYAFDRATGDWVFWVDADDVVMNAERIRPSIAGAGGETRAFYWKYLVDRDQYGNSTCEFWRERCVRNDGGFRWVGRVHEVLVPQGHCGTSRIEDVSVVHLREPRPDRLPSRNLDILQEELFRSRRRPSARLLLCLANEYADGGDPARALDYFARYFPLATWAEEKYFAQLKAAGLCRRQGRWDAAIDLALQAMKTIADWPNAYFSLAETYYFLRDWSRVAHWIEIGRRLRAPDSLCIHNPRECRYDWIVHYTNALFHLGRIGEALEWSEQALAICPGDTWHAMNWHFFAETMRRTALDGAAAAAPGEGGLPTIFWHGPLFDASGYAEEGRQFVLGVIEAGDRVRAIPYFNWNPRRTALPAAQLETLNRAVCTRVAAPSEQVISVFHLTADGFERIPGALLHVGRTMCETDRIPAHWVDLCNRMDQVWVPSHFNVGTFAASGVDAAKLVRVPGAVDAGLFTPEVEPLPVAGRRGFVFLSIFEWSRRKGWDVLLRAFVEEFAAGEDVSLVLKTGAVDARGPEELRREAANYLRQLGLRSTVPENVLFHAGNLSAADIPRLYRAADAFVLPSRGEGWGRPLMEAMAMGLPCVATRWSGHLDFMTDDNSWLVDCQLVEVPEHGWREAAIYRGHRWAEPDPSQLRRCLREIYDQRAASLLRARRGREQVVRTYNRAAVAALIRAHLRSSLAAVRQTARSSSSRSSS